MKTAKLRAKGRKQAALSPLTDAQIMILIRGPLAPFNPDTAPDERAQAVRLAASGDGLRQAAQLWDQHEGLLRQEAVKRGLKPAFGRGAKLYWAEAFATRLREHTAQRGAA